MSRRPNKEPYCCSELWGPVILIRSRYAVALVAALLSTSCTAASQQTSPSYNPVASSAPTPPAVPPTDFGWPAPPPPPSHLPPPPKDCPLYSTNLSRWSDNYGVHVEGSAISLPGWQFSFSTSLQVLSPTEVAVTLVPKRTSTPSSSTIAGTMPGSIEQHVYGFWRRPWGSPPVVTVEVRCGHLPVQRAVRLPLTLPPDPVEIPTIPPPPPPRGE